MSRFVWYRLLAEHALPRAAPQEFSIKKRNRLAAAEALDIGRTE